MHACVQEWRRVTRIAAGYIAVAVAFVAFAVANGGIAVGDREAHRAVLHAAQLPYACLFTAAAFLFICLPESACALSPALPPTACAAYSGMLAWPEPACLPAPGGPSGLRAAAGADAAVLF